MEQHLEKFTLYKQLMEQLIFWGKLKVKWLFYADGNTLNPPIFLFDGVYISP